MLKIALLILCMVTLCHAQPLSTKARWIVDEQTGERVKLACANWAAHLEPMLPEGLNMKPVNDISRHIALMGFNCVRLTWATHMYTRHSNLTVAQNFQDLNLTDEMAGIAKNNPDLLSLTVVDAQKAVIESLGSHGVMVILDNQVGHPMWCCNDDDGNGFFGDKYFHAGEWLRSLRTVADRYKNTPMVVGMSLRNELRGPLQDVDVWYKYMQKGAETINGANPNVLVLVSGLHYDLDFRFLREKPMKMNLKGNKVVYEMHRYAFTEGQGKQWLNDPIHETCDNITAEIQDKAGFLMKTSPVFVSEFGVNQEGTNPADNAFVACYLSYLAEHDLDWAIWALQGSYYIRNGERELDETFGMFNVTWNRLRNPDFLAKLQLIQKRLQDPNGKDSSYYIMYHPTSGRCASVANNEVYASDCRSLSKWSHAGDGTPIKLVGTPYCLTAVGDGLPVAVTTNCMSEQTSWKVSSESKYKLANVDEHGTELCLEWDPYYSAQILTRSCLTSNGPQLDIKKDITPQSQWFRLIKSNAKMA